MKAVVYPVRSEGTDGFTHFFAQCDPAEAEYWALAIEHEPGYQLHVKDYKRKEKAMAMRDALNLALKP